MKKTLALVAITCTALLNAHGGIVYTLFNIPDTSSNVGSFSIQDYGLYNLNQLSFAGSYQYPYAYRFFTPSVTGSYTFGMTYAPYDSVMILYSGQTSFPANPATGAFALNDDGAWSTYTDPDTLEVFYYFGNQTVNPTAGGGNSPEVMPLIKNQSLTAGINYLVAITTRSYSSDPIPLPASFFVAGPGAVTLDGAGSGAGAGAGAVPEPGTWAAAAMLVGGAGFLRWRKRAKLS